VTPVKRVHAADLFAGAGGTSTGLAQACRALKLEVDLLAVNHWPEALQTHEKNHPWARHLCQEIDQVEPKTAVPSGHLNLLVASPECTHFSVARGGRPVQPQKRTTPWNLLTWLDEIRVDSMLVENVPEFRGWGPIGRDQRPVKSRKGETYREWLTEIRKRGYNVDARVVNAADHGDATSRNRLFVIAKRGDTPVRWPNPSYSRGGAVRGTRRWRAAREVIDWGLRGESIFKRKRPLAVNTWKRVLYGLDKYGGPEIAPFVEALRKEIEAAGFDPGARPKERVHTSDGRFIVPPLGFHARDGKANRPRSPDEPLQSLTQRGGGHVYHSFVLSQASGGAPRSTEEPLPTIVAGDGGGVGIRLVVDAFLVGVAGRGLSPTSVEDPLPTLTHRNTKWVIEPFLVPNFGERETQVPRVHDVKDPVPSVTSHGAGSLVEPFLVKYYGTARTSSVDAPVPSLTAKDRLLLVQPVIEGKALEIYHRMLQPPELSRAMGFPDDYMFVGNRGEVVKQIGNAVAVNVARALCTSLLSEGGRVSRIDGGIGS
jgi:DNA (cytosine-5)-methyltransferase 1